jgi:hypothetical protein
MIMNASRASLLIVALIVASVGLPLVAGITCWREWRGGCDAQTELSQAAAATEFAGSAGDEIARLDEEKAVLSRKLADRHKELETAEARRMPLEAAATQRQILEVLNLAARSEITVVEMTRLGEDGQPVTANNIVDPEAGVPVVYASAEFLNRFSPGNTRRPLVRLRCQADYPAVRRFFSELKTLHWDVTPVQFDMETARIVTPVTADEETWLPDQNAADDEVVRLTVVFSL